MRVKHFLALAVWLPCSGSATAEVSAQSAAGFVSEHRLELAASPERAYEALTKDVALWWDATHSYSGKAANFTLDARPGGCFCEALPGGGVEHMRVSLAAPGKRLHMIGGLGPLQVLGASGTMSFVFVPRADGSTLEYRYAVNGFSESGLQPLAEPVDQVQLAQLRRLQRYLATGAALNR
ncbi:MAG: hypothetical protein AB8B93_13175 [Pseudomonadales bacterium]